MTLSHLIPEVIDLVKTLEEKCPYCKAGRPVSSAQRNFHTHPDGALQCLNGYTGYALYRLRTKVNELVKNRKEGTQ